MKRLPDIDLLRELLSYNPESGELRWSEEAPRNRGCVAGRINNTGYRQITVRGEMYQSARICWALYYNEDPHPMQVDHINRNRTDDAITNLRKVTPAENCANREYTNTARPNRDYTYLNVPVGITYPDGGNVIARSTTLAGYILNVDGVRVRKALHRGHGKIHQNRKDTGIRVTYSQAS